MSRPRKVNEEGVALVVTVIVVAMLAVVAVAMMQSNSVDRLSSRSVANYYRAQLAAASGAAIAGSLMASQMDNDHFIVVANTSNQVFVGTGKNQTAPGTFSYVPLLSSGPSIGSAPKPVVTAGIPTAGIGDSRVFTNKMPGGLSVTSPPVAWIYLTNTVGGKVQTNARVAFWVEDLGGKLDLSVVGVTSASEKDGEGRLVGRRPSGTNPAEIALWSLFNSSSESDPGNADATKLAAARSNVPTPATAGLVSAQATNFLGDLAARLGRDTNEPEIVPYGFGYADQGEPKINLNANLGSGGVIKLSDAITSNLKNFSTRSGAMNPLAYVKNIAANIIDYADQDADPTVDNAGNPTYLGIENIPWPNELFDRVQFRDVTSDGKIRIELIDYLEVWNMGDKDTAQTTITIENNYDMALDFTNPTVKLGFSSNLKDAKPYANSVAFVPRQFKVPALKPNEYKVVRADDPDSTRKLEWQSPSASNGWIIFSPADKETTNMSFKAFVGGTLIQQTKGGRWPRHLARTTDGLKAMPETPNRFIFCNPIGFGFQTQPMSQSGKPTSCGGDPRAQLFLSGSLRAANYNTAAAGGGYASPGGRNWEQRNMASFPSSEVNAAKFWPDTGHANSNDLGLNPADYNENPNDARFVKTPLTNNFVMRRNDSGSFSNILELGNIYDPLQWADRSGSGVDGQPGLWTNLTDAAVTNAQFGGRNTLRIGRWEFSKFTNDGTRASQLLDIFAAGPTNARAVLNRVAGRININTASTNVLRALAAGVTLGSDAALDPGSTNFSVPTSAVSAFVDGVVRYREKRPFLSPSQLSSISSELAGGGAWPSTAVFGNSNLAKVKEWNDSAAEEWFAKVYPLSTVRSRNFLVFAVGQALQPANTNVLSTANAVFQIYMQPLRDTNTGLTTNCVPRVVQSWSL